MVAGPRTPSKGGLKTRRNGATKSVVNGGGMPARLSEAAKDSKTGDVPKAIAFSLVDYSLMLSLVFGGCCSSVESVIYFPTMNANSFFLPETCGRMSSY